MPAYKRNRPSAMPDALMQTKTLFMVIISTVAISVMFSLYHLSGSETLPDGTSMMLMQLAQAARRNEAVALKDDETFQEQIDAALSYVQSIEKVERKLIFFHIPKTAGTAIEYAAGTKHIPWGSCLFNHKPKRDICQYPGTEEWPQYVGWWHLPVFLFPLANTNPYQNAELFGVIRNPYDRMVSEFYYICTLKEMSWRPNQCDRDRLFDEAYMNEWLSQKLRDRERDSGMAYAVDNGHFTPQYEFVFGPHEVRMLDYVLQMDNGRLSEDFERLMHAYGLDKVKLKKVNALGAAERGDAQTHLDVHNLTETSLQWIHELYEHDFAYGGYEKRKAEKR